MDVHEDIHRAAENYHDPEEFRRCVNQALQDARAVTFLLQKRKTKWPDFDKWYSAWTTKVGEDPIMRWSIRSRNRIVKEEDLETRSLAEIVLYGARLEIGRQGLQVPPATTALDIASGFLPIVQDMVGPTSRKGHGNAEPLTIGIVRRWIDSELPDVELLTAFREIYRQLSHVVKDAHEASGVSECQAPTFRRTCITNSLTGRLACLPAYVDGSTLYVDVASGTASSPRMTVLEHDEAVIKRIGDRYGPRPVLGQGPYGDMHEYLTMAKAMLEADGYVGHAIFLYYGERVVGYVPLVLSDRAPREAQVQLAIDAVSPLRFDGAVISSEIWLRTYESLDLRRKKMHHPSVPHDRPFYNDDLIGGASEAITVTALAPGQEPKQIILEFSRLGKKFLFKQPYDDQGEHLVGPMFRPLRHAMSS
jgi:hypothetical protein